ncbi:hypothetical protein [Heyndrickxia coagulans]|uniref:type II toxin-antitoxin system RelE family toxin n=1 Tax=Heyndrickxia coagulans TaxID=1398 RepID=UPI002E1DB3DD|nr:hypothetical protein [Heyndrickxia coagulans]
MGKQNVFDIINQKLIQFNTRVYFAHHAVSDFKGFSAGKKNQIIALIIKQAQKGPLLRPDGNGIRLKGKLKNFGKIKNKAMNIRIIYRPVELDDMVEMQIIAIGPRDREEVYEKAKDRLTDFFAEVEGRKGSN